MTFKRSAQALAVLAAITAAGAARADEIKIGISLSTTGPAAALGIPAANLLALLPREIAGQKLNVILLDDGGDPTKATTNARRFATEDKVDILMGSSITPPSTAIGNVAMDYKIPHLALAPVALPPDRMKQTFLTLQMPPLLGRITFEDMKARGVKTVAMIGFADSWGDLWVAQFKKIAIPMGLKLVADERYGRADTSVSGQVLKALATRPDAVFVAASGTGSGLPQIALHQRGFKGPIYQTAGSVSKDFIRISGKDAEGVLIAGSPSIFPDLITVPEMKVQAEKFVKMYEDKYGAGTRSQFAANVFDAWRVLDRVIPVAMKSAKPGTQAFRDAILKAIESEKEIVGCQAIYNYNATDHFGLDKRAVLMLTVKNGQWAVADAPKKK